MDAKKTGLFLFCFYIMGVLRQISLFFKSKEGNLSLGNSRACLHNLS